MRRALLTTLLCALATALIVEGSRGQERGSPALAEDKAAKNIKEVLEQRFDLGFENVPLQEVAKQLTQLTGVTFYFSQKKLEEASVSPDTPVNSSFKNIRLRTWLETALKEFELGYMVKDELIIITTPEDIESNLFTRVYDCRDLFALPDVPVSTARESGKPEAALAAELPRRDPPANPSSAVIPPGQLPWHETRIVPLVELVLVCVNPDSWDAVGGPGAIDEYRGMIVVTQTSHVHEKVERLFDMLREAAGLDPDKAGKVVR